MPRLNKIKGTVCWDRWPPVWYELGSAAEMPVVTPSRASIETVKAVPKRDWFYPVSWGATAGSAPFSSVYRQADEPLPCSAMKLTALRRYNLCCQWSGSPSFSLSFIVDHHGPCAQPLSPPELPQWLQTPFGLSYESLLPQ
jgi:hypothetical protein